MSIYAVLACLPATIPEVCRLTDLAPGAVIDAIQEARCDGHLIDAIRDESVANVPARAKTGPDFLTTVYDIADQRERQRRS